MKAPLARLGIVQTEAETFEPPCWPVGYQLDEISAAIPDLSDHGRAVHFGPRR